jgi:hypothetical protein
MTHEELRTIVLMALAEEHDVDSVNDREFALPTDGAVMLAATMSIQEISDYVLADHGGADTALLQYADAVAQQFIMGGDEE